MDPERFRRLEELFHAALERTGGERQAFLDRACAGDDVLHAEVERLLHNDEVPDDLVDRYTPFPPRDPMVGTALGPWQIRERLAEGGMSVVYRGVRTDGMFDQEVAVKLLRFHTDTAAVRQRFELERRTLGRLHHPNIARLLDGGALDDDTPYLVMELIDGLPIDRYCTEGRLPLAERLKLFTTVCRTVHFAHRNLVLHRDLKPSNVLVDRHGVVKLLDFGIARLLDRQDERTRTAARVLTPEYASPEQLRGHELTTASDVYSLGVVLYQLLTGRKPLEHSGQSPGTWEQRVAEEEPTRPSLAAAATGRNHGERTAAFARAMASTPARLGRQLQGDLDNIVLMALRKEPDRRYASAEELAHDVEAHLAGLPVRARKDTFLYRAQRFVRRNRLAVGAAALVVLALCAAVVATWRGQRQAEAAAEHARIEADSFGMTAEFLADTFLHAIPLDSERERLGESIARHAERVRRQHAGAPHLRANLLDALGELALRVERPGQAGALIAEAEAIRLEAFGADSLEAALSLRSRGRLAYHNGDYTEAADTFRKALELHRQLPGDVHTDVASAANDLAAALRKLRRLEEARALHEEALELRRAAVGPGTLPVAETFNNLACVELDAGNAEAAHGHAGEALALRGEILGPVHADTLQTMTTLAGAAWRLGKIDEAAALLREAVAGYRAQRGEGRQGLTHALSNLAAVHVRRGELGRAQELAEEVVTLARDRLGPDHPDVAMALGRIAEIAARRGDAQRARTAWRETLRIRREALPPGHRTVAFTLLGYGTFLVRQREIAGAEELLREGLRIARQLEAPDADLVARLEMTLGVCLGHRGRTDAARALLERAVAHFEAEKGTDSREARTARSFLERLGQ